MTVRYSPPRRRPGKKDLYYSRTYDTETKKQSWVSCGTRNLRIAAQWVATRNMEQAMGPDRVKAARTSGILFREALARWLEPRRPLFAQLDRQITQFWHERPRRFVQAVALFRSEGSELVKGSMLAISIEAVLDFAGERSGSLDAVLRRFVEYTKVVSTVKRKTVSALIYPAVLITLALVLVGIIVFRVVPAFTDFYASFDAEHLFIHMHDIEGVSVDRVQRGVVGPVLFHLPHADGPAPVAPVRS